VQHARTNGAYGSQLKAQGSQLQKARGSITARPVDEETGVASEQALEETLAPSRLQIVLERIRRFREGGMLIAVLLTCLVFTVWNSSFIQTENLANIGSQISFFAIMAVGMTYVLIAGDIDLSIGSMVGLGTVIFGLLLEHGWNIWVACAAALAIGTAMGAFNGVLSVVLRVPTIIVTLGMLNVYRGIAYLLTNGYPVENYSTTGPFFDIGQNNFLNVIPYTAIVLVVFAVIGGLVLRMTVFGQQVYALGSNRRAAELSGIPVQRIRISVLAILGFACGLAGLLTVSETATANPNTGIGYELQVIAAVIIGGAKLTGGSGTVLASVLGMLLIGIISNGLVLVGVSIYAQVVVSGAIVVIAVTIDRFITRRSGGGLKRRIASR
jgi:ribose transport system permease protein